MFRNKTKTTFITLLLLVSHFTQGLTIKYKRGPLKRVYVLIAGSKETAKNRTTQRKFKETVHFEKLKKDPLTTTIRVPSALLTVGISEAIIASSQSLTKKGLERLEASLLVLYRGKSSKINTPELKNMLLPRTDGGYEPLYAQFAKTEGSKQVTTIGEKDGIRPDGHYQLTVSDDGKNISLEEIT